MTRPFAAAYQFIAVPVAKPSGVWVQPCSITTTLLIGLAEGDGV